MNPNQPIVPVAAPPVPASPPAVGERRARQKRREELRAEEWNLHRELLAAARATLNSFYQNPQKATVADLARLIDLASRLGRLATEPDHESDPGDDGATVLIEFHAALRKVYARRGAEGRPLPAGPVIDATTSPPAAEGAP